MTEETSTPASGPATPRGDASPAPCAALAGLFLGYVLFVSGATRLAITPRLTESTLKPALLVALVLAVAAIGALKGGWLADRTSRRTALRTAAGIGIVGAVIAVVAPVDGVLDAGRAVMAFAAGSLSAVAPIAVAERAPRKRRGMTVVLIPLFVVLGLAGAFLADVALDAPMWWRALFVPAVLIAVGLFVAAPQDLSADTGVVTRSARPWRTTFSGRTRAILAIAIVIAIGQELTGIDVLIARTRYLFVEVSIAPHDANLWAALSLGFFALMGIALARYFVDHNGRTRLMRFGLLGLTVALVALTALTFVATDARGEIVDYLAIAVVWVGVFAFALSLGSIGWVLISEILPAPTRGLAAGTTFALHWLAALLVALTATPLARNLGEGSVFAFSAIAAVIVLLVVRRLPETNGMALGTIANLMTRPAGPAEPEAQERSEVVAQPVE